MAVGPLLRPQGSSLIGFPLARPPTPPPPPGSAKPPKCTGEAIRCPSGAVHWQAVDLAAAPWRGVRSDRRWGRLGEAGVVPAAPILFWPPRSPSELLSRLRRRETRSKSIRCGDRNRDAASSTHLRPRSAVDLGVLKLLSSRPLTENTPDFRYWNNMPLLLKSARQERRERKE